MRLYGLRPWDLLSLTRGELAALTRDLNAMRDPDGS